MKRSINRALRQGLATVLVLAGLGAAMGGPAGATVPPPPPPAPIHGTAGFNYTGAGNPPTADKPQSKLWWNDGSWWADMWAPSKGWRIHKLDRAAKQWVDTGVAVDSRANTSADTLWDGTHLYIAHHVVTISTEDGPKASRPDSPARLYKYSYANGKYTLSSGFPTEITRNSSESMTIDKDSTGAIWATWTQVSGVTTGGYTSKVMVNNSAAGGTSWGTPQSLTGVDATVAPDDISSIVAFGKNKIGVMWSDHTTGSVWWASRTDGQAATSWKVQSAVRGPNQADDHLNIKSLLADTTGRVFAAVKTSFDMNSTARKSDPQLQLLVFKPATGAFDKFTISTIGDCQTRPQIVLDPENNKIHAFQSGPATTVTGCPYSGVSGAIYQKTASMDNPVFAAGRGTPVIQDSTPSVNNVTTSKQPVTSKSGMVILASDNDDKRYWFADFGIEGTKVTEPGTFVPVPPTRLLDTRDTSAVPADTALSFQVAGRAGMPEKISSVVLNLTVTQPQSYGHIRAYPSGTDSSAPNISNVNFSANQTVPNSVTVPVGPDGKVTLMNSSGGSTQLIADVSGYYLEGAPAVPGAFVPVGPSRIVDTRSGAPVAANSGHTFQVAGVSGIPADASAVIFNLTVTQPKSYGHIQAYPSGAAVPSTSNVNFSENETVPNSVTVPIGSDGKVTLLNSSGGTTHLIADINGYYIGGTPTAVGAFVATGPSRFVDSRNGTSPVGANAALTFRVAGEGSIPANISAVVFNLTVTQPRSFGHILAYPSTATAPNTSNVNFSKDQTVANSVTVPVGSDGKVSLLNSSSDSSHLISDVNGYFLGG